jgi:hypothetical protein
VTAVRSPYAPSWGCPLPLLRRATGGKPAVVCCDAELAIHRCLSASVDDHEDVVETWSVQCANGHVLVEDEDGASVPFDGIAVRQAVARIAPYRPSLRTIA